MAMKGDSLYKINSPMENPSRHVKIDPRVAMTSPECQLEEELTRTLCDLKHEYRADIRDRDSLEKHFRGKFQALNHVKLSDGEFQRLLDEIIAPDVFTAAHTLRNRNSFTRDDGTPLNYTLVNINVWFLSSLPV
jgi:type I restriction enzyme R subunit